MIYIWVFFIVFAGEYIFCYLVDKSFDGEINNKTNFIISLTVSIVIVAIFAAGNLIVKYMDNRPCPYSENVVVKHNKTCYIKITQGYIPADTKILKSLED